VVVDRRCRRLASGIGLNSVLHGGSFPHQDFGCEPQDVAGLPVPRIVRRAGSVDGHASRGSLSP